MTLPNADRAVIKGTKLFDYLLSNSHPVGRFKAKFFANLGYSQENWQRFETDLRNQHLTRPATLVGTTGHGRKYEIRAILNGPNGRASEVVSAWIIRNGEDVPRFVTAYPGGSPMTFRELDIVVLEKDFPAHGLKRGDLGAVVEVYEPDAVEVEFVAASGKTKALVTLNVADIRAVGDDDLVSVRAFKRTA